MTAGQLLRESRRRHGVTQAQLAARARTSQAAISRIEQDVVSPSVATLAVLLDLMGEELQLSFTPIDYGHNLDVIRENLERVPSERIDQGAFLGNLLLGKRASEPKFRPTLHSEIARVVAENRGGWMTTRELAEVINKEARYRRPDRKPVTAYQIHGRTKNYPDVFERRGSRVRLARHHLSDELRAPREP